MNYSSRFFLYAPLAAFLTLAVGAMAYWWVVAGAIDKKLHALKGHEAAPGITLDWSKVTLSGFPFRIDIFFDGFSARGQAAHGPFAWTAEHFAVHALTYGAEKDVFEAAGRQTLSWTGAEGKAHAVSFLPGSLRASAIRDTAHGLTRFDLDIIDAGSRDFTAGRLQFHMRRDPNGRGLDLVASADVLNSPALSLRTLRLAYTLDNAAPFAALLKGEGSWPAASAAWRAARGAVMPGPVTGIAPAMGAALLSPLY